MANHAMQASNCLTGAEAMLRMLDLHGVRHVFGLCGDTSLPFYDAFARMEHPIRHHLLRDERHAAYAADAYARLTGLAGVTEGPSGGGATHILPGVAEANESSVPLLAITTDVATASSGRYPLTELDQEALFGAISRRSRSIRSADSLPREVRAAFRAATASPTGAAHLGLPIDVQQAPVDSTEVWADERFGRYPALRTAPDPSDLDRCLQLLLRAARPVAVAGGGVLLSRGSAALQTLLELLDMPLCTSVSGQGAVPETHPNCAGVVGANGGVPATARLLEEADLVLFLGCRAGSVTTEKWRLPKPGTTVLHIDADAAVLGANFPTAAPVCADLRLALEQLAAAASELRNRPRFDGARRAGAAKQEKRAAFRKLAACRETPLRPEFVIHHLQMELPENRIIVADPGTPCPYFSAYMETRRPGYSFLANRAHGALGYALGAAIGAQIAEPERCVVAAMGDGSFGFTVGELETLVRLSLPVKIIVFSNGSYGWIKAGQKHGFGQRYFSVDFTRTDHAAVAAGYGIPACRVASADQLVPALRKTIQAEGPALVDVLSQPLEQAAAPVSEWIA